MTAQSEMRLWPGDAPGARGTNPEDIPTITPFLVEPKAGATSPAMVICPGGGYGMLADHEGTAYAKYLNTIGVSCFVLKYRLGSNGYRHPVMLQDAARAVRMVRAQASDWKVDPKRVGIMGSSAGGHLASTLLTHFDAGDPTAVDPVEKESSRPDIGVLCYAVISMGKITHGGSKANLLGANPTEDLVKQLSNELQVTPQTPPCFIWHTGEDAAVPVENSLDFALALQRNKVPYDLHIYQNGQHGIGLADSEPFTKVHPWAKDLAFWLAQRKFL